MRFLAITAGGDFHPAPRTIATGTKQPDSRVLFATSIRRRNDLFNRHPRIRDKTRWWQSARIDQPPNRESALYPVQPFAVRRDHQKDKSGNPVKVTYLLSHLWTFPRLKSIAR